MTYLLCRRGAPAARNGVKRFLAVSSLRPRWRAGRLEKGSGFVCARRVDGLFDTAWVYAAFLDLGSDHLQVGGVCFERPEDDDAFFGGWSEMKRLGRNGRERVKGDERILGIRKLSCRSWNRPANGSIGGMRWPAGAGTRQRRHAGEPTFMALQGMRCSGRVRIAASLKHGHCSAIGAGRRLV